MPSHRTWFFDWFEARRAAQRFATQQGVADAVHDLLPDENLQTLREKLNKLVQGTAGGAAYYLGDTPDARARAAALAKVLGASEDELRDVHERSRSRPTLILDPRLPAEARSALVAASTEMPERFVTLAIEATDGSDLEVVLREAAKAEPNPFLVLAKGEGDARQEWLFFKGADLRCVTARFHQRGWVLSSPLDDLVPLPPAAKPRQFDDFGTPLLPVGPDDHLAARYEWFVSYLPDEVERLAKNHVWPANRRGETYSLTLEQALKWFSSENRFGSDRERDDERYPRAPLRDVRIALRAKPTPSELAGVGNGRPTLAWTEGGRVFGFGPEVERLRGLYARWHEVHAPPWADLWQSLTAPGVNPWWIETQLTVPDAAVFAPFRALLGEWFEYTGNEYHRKSLEQEAGPDLATLVRRFCESERRRLLSFVSRGDPDLVASVADEDLDRARELLAALAARDVRAAPECLRLALVLKHAARSALVVVPTGRSDCLRVLVDPGGGTLVEIRTVGLRSPARPFVKVYGSVDDASGKGDAFGAGLNAGERITQEAFDGGDVLLWYGAFSSHLPSSRAGMERCAAE